MSHDRSVPDASLQALLFELTTLSKKYKGLRWPRPAKSVTVAPQRPKTDTEADILPEYGLGPIETYAFDYFKTKSKSQIGMDNLEDLVEVIQQGHRIMGEFKTKGVSELRQFIEHTCGHLKKGPKLDITDAKLNALGSPAVELALILYRYGHEEPDKIKSLLPRENSTVITSVATAGSVGRGEWQLLLDAIGIDMEKYYDFHQFKTIRSETHTTGRTNGSIQKDEKYVTYDERAPREKWPDVSEKLYQQLHSQSERDLGEKRAAAIFHWGCISHHDTLTPDGAVVEDWAHHEHWNMLYCIAMARHALEFLETGGTLVLKVRIFKNTKTHGLVALLACAFDDFRIYPNARMPAEYASFMGLRFQGGNFPTVISVKNILRDCTSYEAVPILCHHLTAHSTYKTALQRASEVLVEMERDHDRVALITNNIMYWINRIRLERETKAVQTVLYANLVRKLEILRSAIPVPIDKKWIPDIKKRIETIITEITPQQQKKLSEYINTFEIQKFR
jgi:hypothetical protein